MKEKLEKLKKLADAMYYAAQHLTTDASRLHKAMEEYHQFIINEYHKKEPTIPDIVDEHFYEMLGEKPVRENLICVAKQYVDNHVFGNEEDKFSHSVYVDMFCSGANWQKEQDKQWLAEEHKHIFAKGRDSMKQQMMAKAIEVTIAIPYPNGYGGYTQLVDSQEALPFGENIKVLVIKES